MKALTTSWAVGAVLICGTIASAAEPFFGSSRGPSLFGRPVSFQVPTPAPSPAPYPETMPPGGGTVALFQCVEYKDLDNVHPCAVKKIVMIKDPCACQDPCSCCAPKCVAVCICVPPCGCEEVKVSRNGDKVKYDYGEYEVELRVRKGYIEVDYDD